MRRALALVVLLGCLIGQPSHSDEGNRIVGTRNDL